MPGLYLELAQANPSGQQRLTYSVRAGFAAPVNVRNHLLMKVHPEDVTPDEAQQADYVQSLHTAMVKAWQPEHLAAYTRKFMKKQNRTPQQLAIGWRTYISDDMDFDDETLVGHVVIEHADGGRYFTLDGTIGDPSLEQALLVRKALGYE